MKRSAPDAAPIVKPEPQEAERDALENANAIDMETQRDLEQAPAPAPASSTPHGGMRTIPPQHLVTTPTTFTQRKLPSMRGHSPAQVAAQREAMRQRFGEGAQASEEQTSANVPLDANGRPKKPEAAWARWGRGEDDDRQRAAAAPAAAPTAAAPAPIEIPEPPAHLTAAGTALRIPTRPKLPNHRALMRPDAFLLPFTHPLSEKEEKVVYRSTRLQQALKKKELTTHGVQEVMDLICNQAYDIVHVGGNAMTFWLDNVKAEIADRRIAPANTTAGLIAQWLTFATISQLFAGLTAEDSEKGYDGNKTISPIMHYLYDAERKQQEQATAKAQKKIDTWESKHGEAMRKREEVHTEWIAYAQERANAVAQREMHTHPTLVGGGPHTYVYDEVRKHLAAETGVQPTVEGIKRSVADTQRNLLSRTQSVDDERLRYERESKDIPPFKVQILLRNARAAADVHNQWLRKEIARAKEERQALELKSRSRTHQKQRVIWELGSLSLQRRNIRRAAEGAIGYALNDMGNKHGCQLPDWVPGPWHKPIDERIEKAEAVRKDLFQRCADLDKMLTLTSDGVSKLEDALEALEGAVARLPPLEPERGSGSDDDDGGAVCTGVVTREERDAKGWQEAQVLE